MLIKKTLKYLLFLVTGLQIVLGLIWMGANLGHFLQFSLTEEMIEISRTWILDEYAGAGYPALIFAGRILEDLLSVPFYIWLYVVQAVLAFGSGCFLLASLFGKKRTRFEVIWGSLYLMTIPMTAQLHFSVLPFSAALSLSFVLIGCLKRMTGQEEGHRRQKVQWAVCTAVVWILLLLMLPETFWMTAVLGAVAAGIAFSKKRVKSAAVLAAVLVLSLGIGGGVNAWTQEPGSRGNMQKSISSIAMSRVVWPYFDMDYYFWPIEIKEVMSEDMAWTVSCYAERIRDLFGPAVEEFHGQERAAYLYREMVKICFDVRTKDVVKQIFEDFMFYACPQISVNLQLDGVGAGLNAYNYYQMKDANPVLTKYYVNYSLNSFPIALFLGLVCFGYRLLYFKNRRAAEHRKIEVSSILLLAVPAVWQLFYSTFTTAGMVEYKNAWFITAVYGMMIVYWLWAIWDGKEEGDYDGQDCSTDTVL